MSAIILNSQHRFSNLPSLLDLTSFHGNGGGGAGIGVLDGVIMLVVRTFVRHGENRMCLGRCEYSLCVRVLGGGVGVCTWSGARHTHHHRIFV